MHKATCRAVSLAVLPDKDCCYVAFNAAASVCVCVCVCLCEVYVYACVAKLSEYTHQVSTLVFRRVSLVENNNLYSAACALCIAQHVTAAYSHMSDMTS